MSTSRSLTDHTFLLNISGSRLHSSSHPLNKNNNSMDKPAEICMAIILKSLFPLIITLLLDSGHTVVFNQAEVGRSPVKSYNMLLLNCIPNHFWKYIYTSTFMWSSTIQLNSDSKKQMLMSSVMEVSPTYLLSTET